MISYFILILAISLVSCDSLEHERSQFEDVAAKTVVLQERYLKEKSTELLHKLIQKLKAAYDKGAEVFDNVINDKDIKEILDHMDALTRRIAQSIINKFKNLIKKIDEATKENPELLKRDLKENSRTLLNRLVQILLDAYKQGIVYFSLVVLDPDVQGILEHLGPLSRKIADSIIQEFRELINKIDEATKDNNEVSKRDFKESSFNLLKKLTNILTKAFQSGSKAFNEALEDPDVKEILASLDGLSRRAANYMIERFKEMIIKLDEVTNDQPKYKRGLIENTTNNMKKLIQILIQAAKKGSEYFRNIINDPDFIAMQDHLNSIEQRVIYSIIKKFLEIFDKIDNATKVESDVALGKRGFEDFKDNATVQLKKLTQILLKAYRKGAEYFDKVVNDPDVQNILEHLGPLSRKIANSIIDNFRELIEKIDNATKEN